MEVAPLAAMQINKETRRDGVYVPGLVMNSIMNCGGPSYFMKIFSDSRFGDNSCGVYSKNNFAQWLNTQKKHNEQASAKEAALDIDALELWLRNGSMNDKLIQQVTKAIRIRKNRWTVADNASPPATIERLIERLSTQPKRNTPARCRTEKLEQGDEGRGSSEITKTISRWWFSGFYKITRFILEYAGGLIKRRTLEVSEFT